jgi:hypothetical protein
MLSDIVRRLRSHWTPLFLVAVAFPIITGIIGLVRASFLLTNLETVLGAMTALVGLLAIYISWETFASARRQKAEEMVAVLREQSRLVELMQASLVLSSRAAIATPPPSKGLQSGQLAEYVERFIGLYPFDKNVAYLSSSIASESSEKEFHHMKGLLNALGFRLFRPDEQQLAPDVLSNLMVLLLSCRYGIAIFDRESEENHSLQNVAFELGIMYSMGRQVLVLKDFRVRTHSNDLLNQVYYTYGRLDEIGAIVEEWFLERARDTNLTRNALQ